VALTTHPICAEVKERVGLYIYSPSGPSWPGSRVNFTFTFTFIKYENQSNNCRRLILVNNLTWSPHCKKKHGVSRRSTISFVFSKNVTSLRSQDSNVSIVTRIGGGRSGSPVPAGARDPKRPDRLGGPPNLLFSAHRGLFSWG
jgi:hypothetical protein